MRRLSRFLAPLAMPALLSCQPTVNLMPVPVADKQEYYDIVPEDRKLTSLTIGYATNRLPAKKGASNYVSAFDQNLRFGRAFLQIGDEELSWDEIAALATREDRGGDVPLRLTGINRVGILPDEVPIEHIDTGTRRVIESLNTYIENSPFKHLTIYVHGANNNFYRAMAQGAQLVHFSGRTSAMIAYSWPSQERVSGYKKDMANITETVPVFVRFIKLLARHSIAERINIISYSAGAQLVAQSLASLGAELERYGSQRDALRQELRLGNIYFAAPDTSFADFLSQLYQFADLVEDVTVTVNEDDYVLAVSQKFGEKSSRLGAPDEAERDRRYTEWARQLNHSGRFDIVYINTEVIPDISKKSHDYWYKSSWVSTDALILLNSRAGPEQRGLESFERNGFVGWTFPADYELRITAIFQSAFEAYAGHSESTP